MYCVCRKPQRGLAMMQCESCNEWYDCICLGIDRDICDKYQESDIKFLCGVNGCNDSRMFVSVNGSELNFSACSSAVVSAAECSNVSVAVSNVSISSVDSETVLNCTVLQNVSNVITHTCEADVTVM